MAELKLPLDFLSSTQIDMYLRCPMQYYYRYRLGKKIPPPWSMYVGRCGHKALDFNFEQKVKTYSDLDFETIGDVYNDEFTNNPARDGVNWQGENEGVVKDKGYGSLQNYFTVEKAQEKIQPLAVQKKIDIQFENKNYGIRAYLDIVTIDKEVGDFKFSLKRPSDDQLANDTQMTIYGISHLYEYKTLPAALWLDYLISLQSGPKYARYPIIRSREHYSSMLEDIGNIAEDISMRCKTDIWFRNKKGWWCSPKSCGYYLLCRPEDQARSDEVLAKLQGKENVLKKG